MEVVTHFKKTRHSYARLRDGILYITISTYLSYADREKVAQKFVHSFERKIGQHPEQSHSLLHEVYTKGICTLFTGETYYIAAQKKGRGVSCVFDRDECDTSVWTSMTRIQQKKHLILLLRKYCQTEVEAEIRAWVMQLGYGTPSEICISDTKSRWGSCTSRGVIRISLRTLLLPYHLFTYVCLHESVHLKYMHHRSEFWNALAQLLPDYKKRVAEIKSFQ